MYFQGRTISPYAKPITLSKLKKGAIYFSVSFIDDDMLIPIIDTLIYLGTYENESKEKILSFQDVESYQADTNDHCPTFFECSEDSLNNIFEYESALEVLMRCSIRRNNILE